MLTAFITEDTNILQKSSELISHLIKTFKRKRISFVTAVKLDELFNRIISSAHSVLTRNSLVAKQPCRLACWKKVVMKGAATAWGVRRIWPLKCCRSDRGAKFSLVLGDDVRAPSRAPTRRSYICVSTHIKHEQCGPSINFKC